MPKLTSIKGARAYGRRAKGSFIQVEYTVIGGGGGGSGMGGGGAGGFREGTLASTPFSSPISVTIGAGAPGATAGFNCTSRGGNSIFHTITASGGGSGASNIVAGVTVDPISDGGSSAGALYNGQIAAAGNAGGYSPEEGYAGGGPNINGWQSGGGGGGAGGGGSWQGGSGRMSSITGYTYAGGGGGGKGDQYGNGAPGGAGGGGTGGGWGYASMNQPTSGTSYGAGGGGIGYAQGYNGGNGYQGVVILKYPNTYTISSSGLTTSTTLSGSYKITEITAGNGMVTFS